jgi:hypothetical protein
VTKPKPKVEVEKPVFCVVEQTKHTTMDRYRVTVANKLKNKTITIDNIIYSLVESEKPTIDGHSLRGWCQAHNGISWQEKQAKAAQQERERVARWEQTKAQREEERKLARKARYEERVQGAKRAGIILKEISIMNRKMEEVETGERCL